MTEAEWLACANPWPMIGAARSSVSDRKLWLFAIVCCHRVRHLIDSPSTRGLIDITEQRVDGEITLEEWQNAIPFTARTGGKPGETPAERAAFAAAHLLDTCAEDAAHGASFHACAAMQKLEGPEAPWW